jgi:hypothetical protein
MKDFHHWKHRNLAIIKYGNEEGVIQAGPVEERQALSDWDRLAKSGEKCTYFIDGEPLSKVQPNGFDSVTELRDFFKQHLFPRDPNAEQLATLAMAHFHQAGLPHATNFSIKNISMSDPNIKVSDPESMINFKPDLKGLIIQEINTYKKWQDTSHGRPVTHECSASKPFYAKTETTYKITPDKEDPRGAVIDLINLEIDCPSQHLAPIFDKRPEAEQTMRVGGGQILKNIVADVIERFKDEPEESSTPTPRRLG